MRAKARTLLAPRGLNRLRKSSEFLAKVEKIPSGAKARIHRMSNLAARLKSCPFKTLPFIEFYRSL